MYRAQVCLTGVIFGMGVLAGIAVLAKRACLSELTCCTISLYVHPSWVSRNCCIGEFFANVNLSVYTLTTSSEENTLLQSRRAPAIRGGKLCFVLL